MHTADFDTNPKAQEQDKDRIVASLETVVQALLGNVLETVRSSVNDLGTETERQIDALREETRASLETLRADLLSEGESLKREALSALETRTNALSERTKSRLEANRIDLDQRLEELEGRLQTEHLSISERLDKAERGLQVHDAASGRITEVLNTLGHVLSPTSAPPQADTISPEPATPVAAKSPSEPATAVEGPDPNLDHDGVPAEIQVALENSTNPSLIETQPVPVGFAESTDAEEVEDLLDRVDLGTPGQARTHSAE